ncbi:MAG: efflux RND transporter periplasmic adaptor subunit [Bacteroidota bacterium]|nr:efflux RND transporter periplasmic adaptor subunit [Bacteroidota bacterium]MDP4211740.1 efflux RND transporter periplasmic adaptor subunit [Bacteroidota bacterium]MDP4251841.1 efflux RND transporter periplasmic adaptor subunit [Bacteroidota bacterium]
MRKYLFAGTLILFVWLGLESCHSSEGNAGYMPATPALPVITVSDRPFTSYQEYSASLEGSKDIEIRPQVNGYLDKIYVDEGTQVKKGQPLFHVNDLPYREALNNAKAAQAAAQANLASAEINVTKLQPLVQNNVVSPVQLKSAQAVYDAAAASVAQAKAQVANAEINIGYSLITAPVDGYIGRIHFKTGSLVGVSTAEPLTILSEVRDIRAYFSFSETDFLRFKEQYPGKTIAEKVKEMPPVELILADNSVYPEKGKVEVVSGQFTSGAGSIPFRASFPNTNGGLRSGNTGKIRISTVVSSGMVVPQEATFDLQEKVFVFLLGDSNKVSSVPIDIAGRTGNYYLVSKGIKPGDRIVYAGVDRLRDGATIIPQTMSLDSLVKARPM